jgi:hypothetical protein
MATLDELFKNIGTSVNTMADDLRNAELEKKMAVNNNLGAAAGMPLDPTRGVLNQLSGGRGDLVNQYVNQAIPLPDKADPWMAAFNYFVKLGQDSSQPGATLLGASTSALQAPMDYLNAKKAEARKTQQARAALGLQIAPSLKPKVTKATYGKPDFYMVSRLVDGKLTEAVETPLTPKQFDDLQPQIKDGSVVITAVPKAGTSGAQSPLGKLIADYNDGKGSMTKDQFDAQFEKLTNVADGSETALEKLEAQAIAGGLEKDSDAYKEWILTGGKPNNGMTLESDGKGGFTFTQGNIAGQKSGRVDKGYIQNTLKDGTVVQQVVPGSLAFTEVETQKAGFEGDIAQANFLLETVDAIIGRPEGNGQTAMLSNPNLDAVLGSVQGKIPMNMFFDQGKTDVLVKIEFLKSNAFMQAFASLKGGGQITEKEGDAATAALAMLNRIQDPKEFTKGLTEFANIIRRGREKAKRLTASLPKIAGTISGGEDVNLNFDAMSPAQLRLIDVKSLTPKQRIALAKKLGI